MLIEIRRKKAERRKIVLEEIDKFLFNEQKTS